MVWDDPNGQQIGWGVYLSTGAGEWKGYEWYNLIFYTQLILY